MLKCHLWVVALQLLFFVLVYIFHSGNIHLMLEKNILRFQAALVRWEP